MNKITPIKDQLLIQRQDEEIRSLEDDRDYWKDQCIILRERFDAYGDVIINRIVDDLFEYEEAINDSATIGAAIDRIRETKWGDG